MVTSAEVAINCTVMTFIIGKKKGVTSTNQGTLAHKQLWNEELLFFVELQLV